MPYEIRECNTCRWYDPMEGYCAQLETYCHGYDGTDCEEFTPVRKRKMQIIDYVGERAEREY